MITSPLDALPVFASDADIAVALVGRKAAPYWLKVGLPIVEKMPGFPKVDALHGGRPVPLVRLFYENYLRLPSDGKGLPDGDEDESAWKKFRRKT